MQTPSGSADFQAITQKQQTVWATGDFNEVARQVMAVADELVRTVDPHAGQRVLDVACGSGNAALSAARRYCEVSGIDYVPALIERAKMRAQAEGSQIDFRVADAQALPFPDGSFDVVLSVFGVMFAPDREKAAAELLRVCKPGGKIGLACWTSGGMVGEFFALQSRRVQPPPGVQPPPQWGTEELQHQLLGPGTSEIRATRKMSRQYFLSPQHAVEVFKTYFGPTARAFQVLDAAARDEYREELEQLYAKYNLAKDGTLYLESEYLEVVATRK